MEGRIQKIIEYKKLNSSQFAEEIGVQRSSISHILSGRNKPSLDLVLKILERFPDIEQNWLLFGKGNMLKEYDLFSSMDKEDKRSSKVRPDENVNNTEEKVIEGDIMEEDKKEDATDFIDIISKNLFSNQHNTGINQEAEQDKEKGDTPKVSPEQLKIERIVIFYQGGKFKSYTPLENS